MQGLSPRRPTSDLPRSAGCCGERGLPLATANERATIKLRRRGEPARLSARPFARLTLRRHRSWSNSAVRYGCAATHAPASVRASARRERLGPHMRCVFRDDDVVRHPHPGPTAPPTVTRGQQEGKVGKASTRAAGTLSHPGGRCKEPGRESRFGFAYQGSDRGEPRDGGAPVAWRGARSAPYSESRNLGRVTSVSLAHLRPT